jgi:hypothetical protein
VEKAGKPINPAFFVDAHCAATGISLATTLNNTALVKKAAN